MRKNKRGEDVGDVVGSRSVTSRAVANRIAIGAET